MIETVLAVPVGVACAAGLIDAGVLLRDRIAVAQAATRAATAHMQGAEVRAAAVGALPRTVRGSAHVVVDNDRIAVTIVSRTSVLRRSVRQRSSVEVVR